MNFRNITSETSFSVQFLEDMLQLTDGECVEFQFFVFATNDAGSGPLARLKDTVPICKYILNLHPGDLNILYSTTCYSS